MSEAAAQDTANSSGEAPGLTRRLAAFVYEGILLFAVAMATGLVYSPLAQQHHALEHRGGLMLALGLSFSAYFIYFWTRSGQTLPMKTWHIRVVRLDGSPLTLGAALLRLLLSLVWWVLPVVASASAPSAWSRCWASWAMRCWRWPCRGGSSCTTSSARPAW
jgi:uncharacterized RDD family membrane protein YckC